MMKKSLITFVLILMAIAVNAQTSGVKISAKYQKGDNMLYRITVVTNVTGKTINVNSENRYVVIDSSRKGYVIESTLEKMETDAEANDMVGRLMNATTEILKGTKVIVITDVDGKVTGIKNIDEIVEKSSKMVDKMFDELFAQLPSEASEMLSKDKLNASIMEQMNEKNIINSMIAEPSPLSLNGKVISTGSTDMVEDANGMKMKNTYTLTTPDAKKVKVTGKMDMNKEEMKKMIVDQVKKIMPQQAEMIEQNIDSVLDSGMFKFEKNQNADYEFGNNGWLKTVDYSSTSNTMGQESGTKGKIELIESNR